MIVLAYLGIGKDSGLDIDTLIDSLNPKIVHKKAHKCKMTKEQHQL